MNAKVKKTAFEISRMVQDAVDPMGKKGRISVSPKPHHRSTWVVIVGSSDPDFLNTAQLKADELSCIYEMDDSAGNQSS